MLDNVCISFQWCDKKDLITNINYVYICIYIYTYKLLASIMIVYNLWYYRDINSHKIIVNYYHIIVI